MSTISQQLAKVALEIEAVKFNVSQPFCWASGFFMPIYNDNRRLLSNSSYRQKVAEGFLNLIQSENIDAEVIAGTATAGIPHATTLADKMSLPLVYVRSKPKGHGLENLIEGILQPKAKTVVVEDVISTGGSSVAAVNALRDAGSDVLACFAIFSYGFERANKLFEDVSCPLFSLVSFDDIVQAAKENSYLDSNELQSLNDWRQDPFNWGEKNGFKQKK